MPTRCPLKWLSETVLSTSSYVELDLMISWVVGLWQIFDMYEIKHDGVWESPNSTWIYVNFSSSS